MPRTPPAQCPECGSFEVRATQRRVIPDGLIDAFVCSNCDWASDPRIGRPPADRSKNYALRQRMPRKSGDTNGTGASGDD